jgi:hypothetical protein
MIKIRNIIVDKTIRGNTGGAGPANKLTGRAGWENQFTTRGRAGQGRKIEFAHGDGRDEVSIYEGSGPAGQQKMLPRTPLKGITKL